MGKLKDLKQGDSGPDVKAVQAALNQVAGASDALAERGKFGPKTDKAVRQYQKDHALKPDGIVGPKTRALIFPLGVATITVFGKADSNKLQLKPPSLLSGASGFRPKVPGLTPGKLTLQPDLSARIRGGMGNAVFTPHLFPSLSFPLYVPRVPDFTFQVPPAPGNSPSPPFLGFVYDHLELQPGGQSTFPLGGLRQDVFFLTMQAVYVRGNPDGKHLELDLGVQMGSPWTGLMANGTPWTFNPFIQLTDVDRFGKLGMFHYWQPYAQLGAQGQGPGPTKPSLTANLYPVNLGFDIGDNLTVAIGGGLAAVLDLQTGKVTAGAQLYGGLTVKFGQPPGKK